MNEFAEPANSDRFALARVGVYLCGLATIAGGILDLVWGDFDARTNRLELWESIFPAARPSLMSPAPG
jgi:hypothetical protein